MTAMADQLPEVPGGPQLRTIAVTEGVFTFVAIDDAGHPRKVPEEDEG
jgi:acyl-CoA hydrolase